MEKRAHADRCQELPKDLPDDVDLMIEVGFIRLVSLSSRADGLIGKGQGLLCRAQFR